MEINKISKNKLKQLAKLKQKKYINLEHKFIIEGSHLIEEAIKANKNVFIYSLEGLDKKEIKSLTNLESPTELIGVCDTFDNKDLIGNRFLLLDEIQDPGNLGTIIRSALAFNVDTIVLGDKTCSLYNEKVLRSTQGAIFHINIISMNLEECIEKLKRKNVIVYGTNVVNGTDLRTIKKSSSYALVMGNEGNGLSKNIQKLCDKNIYIKTNDLSESLNVAMATSIILYELDK